MLSPVTIALATSAAYPIASVLNGLINIPQYNKDIFEVDGPAIGKKLFVKETDNNTSVNGIHYAYWKPVITLYNINGINYKYNNSFYDMEFCDKDIMDIHSHEEVTQLLEKYDYTDNITVKLPMGVGNVFIPGPKIYIDKRTGLMHNNRNSLIKQIMFHDRFPGTFIIPLIGCIIAFGLWIIL